MPPAQPASVQGYFHPQPEGKALPSLILGILALFFSIVTGIPAIILGHLSLSQIKKSSGKLTGEGMATAGLILGYISVALVPFLLMIAIPKLQYSSKSATQAAAAATVRTLVAAEFTYSANYPKAGYAPDLATLGPGGPACAAAGEGTQKNACLIDSELGCPGGTSGNWCSKDQYKYSIAGISQGATADDFIITATPANSNAANTSYCASKDGIPRSHSGAVPQPLRTVAECKSWQPI
ncbi:MAG TPA: DUF4190 domain-containing protein [Candidatus Angelobacter sp.]